MGEIVNLRRARKARARDAAAETAARNRASFGLSKADRAAASEETARRDAALDAHRLDGPRERPDGKPGG